MPIESRDVDGGRGVLITASGAVSGQDYLEFHRDHLTQTPERFRKYRFSLSDYRTVTDVEVPSAAIQEVAGLCRNAAEVNPDIVVGLVTGRDLVFGLGRMWQLLTEGIDWETRVFKSMEEARGWIPERVHARWAITDPTLE